MRLGLALRELEKVEGALDVDLVRAGGRELGPGGEQRGEVINRFYLELRQDALEERPVGDRTGELPPGIAAWVNWAMVTRPTVIPKRR